jgi:nucleotide-binding universal stress UspA family protein
MPPIRKILVPIDFSEQSRVALEYAAGLTVSSGATIDILHVWEPVVFEPSALVPVDLQATIAQATQSNAERMLESFRRSAADRGVSIGSARTVPGAPWSTIVDSARAGSYDLIVIGTHGRKGLSRALIGSVAERVVRHAHCPVLTVRTPGAG